MIWNNFEQQSVIHIQKKKVLKIGKVIKNKLKMFASFLASSLEVTIYLPKDKYLTGISGAFISLR